MKLTDGILNTAGDGLGVVRRLSRTSSNHSHVVVRTLADLRAGRQGRCVQARNTGNI
jgi:hypothetical protein